MTDTDSNNPDPYELNRILEAQRMFFRSGATRSVDFRVQSLRSLAHVLSKRSDDLLDSLASDLAKPGLEAYVGEVFFLLSEIRLIAKHVKRWAKPRRVRQPFYIWPARSEFRFEPFGSTLVVAPWNYPAQLALGPALGSVAAGNTVLIKPSEFCPSTSSLLAEIVSEAFRPEHVTVVQGGVGLGKALLDQSFDFWFYTGGEKVGRLYAEAAARDLAPIVLELGGKCPCVVDGTTDLEKTVERIAIMKFFNGGQTCLAPDFVAVESSRQHEFVERMVSKLREFYPDSPSPDLARIVSDEHYGRIASLLTGDAIRVGEDRREERYFAPTVIPNTGWDDPSMREEIFGPVLPVIAYDDLEDVLVRLSERPSPLALYAFSGNNDTLERIASRIPSGSVCFNDAVKQTTNLHLPFGGVGASGMGRYRGKTSFETFSYARSYVRRWMLPDVFTAKPPYGDRLDFLRKIMK